jgi:hypothetical protein
VTARPYPVARPPFDGRARRHYDARVRFGWSRVLLLALLAVLIAAPVAAAVMVPDPSWIGGVYDGGDSDAVVLLVLELTAGVPPVVTAPPTSPGLPHASIALVVAVVSRPPARSDSRAPPTV